MLIEAGATDPRVYGERITNKQLHKVLLKKESLRVLVADYLASIGEVQMQKQYVSERLWIIWLKELALVVSDNLFRELDERDIGMVEFLCFKAMFFTFIGRRYIDPLNSFGTALESDAGMVTPRIDLAVKQEGRGPDTEQKKRFRRIMAWKQIVKGYKIGDYILGSDDGVFDKLERMLATSASTRTDEEIDLIKAHVEPCLRNHEVYHPSDAQIKYCCRHLKGHRESRGFYIFQQGSTPKALFMVLYGSVLLFSSRNGGYEIDNILNDGSSLGVDHAIYVLQQRVSDSHMLCRRHLWGCVSIAG